MNTKSACIAVAATSLAAIVFGIFTWQAPASTPSTAESPSPQAESRAEHRRDDHDDTSLSHRVNRLASEVSELREEVARLRGEAHRADEPLDPEPELSPEEEKALWDEHMTLVEAGFNEEPTDARWASDTSSLIQRALASQPPLHAATRSTECRSRTCRVELNTDSQGELSDAISSLTNTLGDQLPTVMYDRLDEAGGRQTQVLYFSRQGAEAADEDQRAATR